jgi:hypothetical protein
MKTNWKWLTVILVLIAVLGTLSVMTFANDTAQAQTTPNSQITPNPNCPCDYNGQGRGPNGRGGMAGNGMMGGGMLYGNGRMGQAVNVTPLSDQTKQILGQALDEEYKARAIYQAIVDKYGNELPFVNILRSENMHVLALQRLFTANKLTIPTDNYAGKITAPATLAEAFKLAIDEEKADIVLYDNFLKTVKEPQVVLVFGNLQNASRHHQLSLEFYATK